eukprot:11628389-Karenia_brevis.AAC.1
MRLSSELQQFADAVPRELEGMIVMGSACEGESESRLGPQRLLIQPATKRLGAAQRFGDKINDFCMGSTDPSSLHIAWCLTLKSLREALAYDVRTVPAGHLEPILLQHAQILRECTECILGRK